MGKINEKKYRNIILFFSEKIQNGTLGKLKLMKLLYYLDFDFFEKYGRSITGDEYLRFDNGPVPRMAEKILKEGGCFVGKLFQGGNSDEIVKILRKNFSKVDYFKPESSRKDSSEVYLVALNFKSTN